MIKKLKLASLAVLMVGAMAGSASATVVVTPPTTTNLWSSITLNLTTISQGKSVVVRNTTFNSVSVASLGTKDVIKALAAASGTNFTAKAGLYLVTPIVAGIKGGSSVVVKDGTNVTDVSSYFTTTSSDTKATSNTVKGGVVISGTTFRINSLVMTDNSANNPNLNFNLQGFVESSDVSKTLKGGLMVDLDSDVWALNGTGTHNGIPFVAKGGLVVSVPTVVLK